MIGSFLIGNRCIAMWLLAFSLLVGSVVTGRVNACGNDYEWTAGWGQGISEAIITRGSGNSIYVTCGEHYGRPGHTGIRFMLAGDSPNGSEITLTFDQNDPERIWIDDGSITSNCRACASNYLYVIKKLKRHSSVHVLSQDGAAARFSLSGSAKAIGNCAPDFAVY